MVVYIIAFAIAGVSPQASLVVDAFIAITLLRWLAPSGAAEGQFT